jgi:hypothetical protein
VNADMLLAQLRRRSVMLTVVEGQLRVEAPAAVLTPTDRAALAVNKTELLSLLTCLDCGAALPPDHQYRCVRCVEAAWIHTYGTVPDWARRLAEDRRVD